METLFIYNPNSGKKLIKNSLYDIINVFSKEGYDLKVFATQKRDDCKNYIKDNCSKYERIIVSGGDGTLNEAVSGLMLSQETNKPNLGYIPAGSTNDFANSLNLAKDMVKAAKDVTKGSPFSIDIGKFNDKFFVYIAAFGALTEVSYSTPQDVKNILGHLAYVLEGAKSLTNIKAYDIKVTTDKETFEDKFIYGMVTNSLSVGGTLSLKQFDIDFNDGLFEMILVKEPKNIDEFNQIIMFLLGQIQETNMVIMRKIKKASFESKTKIAWTVDGEFGDNTTSVNINVKEKAITLIK